MHSRAYTECVRTKDVSHSVMCLHACFCALQVPTWLNRFNKCVTVVPHSSIFKDHKHLPTFNSNAILANVANIPGK